MAGWLRGWDARDFLFTRPNSRRYFVWAGWAVGIVECLAILGFVSLIMMVILEYRDGLFRRSLPAVVRVADHRPVAVDIPLLIASVAVFMMVVYSATYFLNALTRSAAFAFCTVAGLAVAYEGWKSRWERLLRAHLPDLLIQPYSDAGPHVSGSVHALEWYAVIACAVCALAFSSSWIGSRSDRGPHLSLSRAPRSAIMGEGKPDSDFGG